MEPEAEKARRLDAEVRGFVEELRLRQKAPRLKRGDLENAATTAREAEAVEIER